MLDFYGREADPENPGWMLWWLKQDGRFNTQLGRLRLRRDGEKVVVRLVPTRILTNFREHIHGGAIMTFIDSAMFAASVELGCERAESGVTVDCTVQFLRSASAEAPIDATIEITRETGRLIFLRGLLEQDGELMSSFTGLLRKGPR